MFENKISALLAASTAKTTDVSWQVSADGYDALDWTIDDTQPLSWFYSSRALQLRDTYDWITLSYSGGHDSSNILRTFITNRIHLDEIMVRFPISAAESHGIQPNHNDLRSSNLISEWYLNVKPDLQKLSQEHPEIKITVIDTSAHITLNYNDLCISDSQGNLNPGYLNRWSLITEKTERSSEKGKKACLLTGLDKPQIAVKDQAVYCYFLDSLVISNTAKTLHRDITPEGFYWTNDFPQLTKAQARKIFHWLKDKPSRSEMVRWNQPYDPNIKNKWNRAINPILYPDCDVYRFQTNKCTAGLEDLLNPHVEFLDDDWGWLIGGKNHNYLTQSWRYHTHSLINSLSDNLLARHNDKIQGLINFPSKFYFLGNI